MSPLLIAIVLAIATGLALVAVYIASLGWPSK